MRILNKIPGLSVIMLTLLLTACTSHREEPQRLSMRNPASEWCLQRGGQQTEKVSSNGNTLYCQLPSGERIEQ